jgi:hypothetical protein
MESINNQVQSVRQLLAIPQLAIPSYQRPYRWGSKNISDLFTDLATHQDKSAYRLGSVVFHQHTDSEQGEMLDIVDGQQRTLTLMLTVKALIEVLDNENRSGKEKSIRFQRQDLREQLQVLRGPIDAFMQRQRFPSRDSEFNLRRNYLELRRLVARPEFDEQQIDFLLNRCQVVCFVLQDISEAFQFFDSQNARGAIWLLTICSRHFTCASLPVMRPISRPRRSPIGSACQATSWPICSPSISIGYASGPRASRPFTLQGEVDLFKGVNLDRVGHYPYVESLRIAHHFVDEYNSQYQRKIDGQYMTFPFHLDQMIINGRRFFEMAEYYQTRVAAIVAEESDSGKAQSATLLGETLTPMASKVLSTLGSYERRHRTGDRYVRAMFDCALIFYIDKFGSQGLSLAIEKCFIWAYRCRIRQQVVQLATMDNYVLEHNLIRAIRDARLPGDLHGFPLPSMSSRENKNNRNGAEDELVGLFREMKYYE